MYCLDTNIIIDIFRGDENLKARIEKIVNASQDIYITYITLCELYKGAYSHVNSDIKIKEINDFIFSFGVLDFSLESCNLFGDIFTKLQKRGKTPQEPDLMIASIVKTYDFT